MEPTILNPHGQPARRPVSDRCPKCGAGPEKQRPSSGFGVPHPVCECGHEWHTEVWRERD